MPKAVEPPIETFARIKVMGVGGAGGAAINRMVDAGVSGVEFVAVNADAQALHHSKADNKVHIGQKTTKGLGAGADPDLGRRSAEESKEDIAKAVEGADMIFVTFGAGGGTGSGAGPIVAEMAKAAGALVVGFATKPFAFEGEKRRRNAEIAIDKLRHHVDTLITIPNDKLLQTIDRRTPLLEAFKVADDVLRQGVQGISDLITVHGLVNLDFADVKTIMADAGSSLMGIGRASGENRAIEAAQQAISSPLLEISIDGARGILFNVIGGLDMSMHEINTVAETITAAADHEANIIFGATINPDLEGEIIVTVVATGFDESYFTSPERTGARIARRVVEPEAVASSQVDEESMQNLDLELKEGMAAHAEDFHSEESPNIWALSNDGNTTDKDRAEEEEKYGTPSFFRRFRRKKGQTKDEPDTDDDDTDDQPQDEDDSSTHSTDAQGRPEGTRRATSSEQEESVEIEPEAEDKSDSSDEKKKSKS